MKDAGGPGGRRDGALAPSASMPRRQRRPRLDGFDYRGPLADHLVLGTAGRRHYLADPSVASDCLKHLVAMSSRSRFRVLAYTVLPDHLHLLLVGMDEDAYLVGFVDRFKQLTGFTFKCRTGRRLWQQSFYDHVLRGEEAPLDVARYVFENPVRAGLAECWDEYALSGGEYFEMLRMGP